VKPHIRIYLKHHDLLGVDVILCEVCGRVAVDVHHIEPKGMGGSKGKDVIENLIALCRACHSDAHAGKISKAKLFKLTKGSKQW